MYLCSMVSVINTYNRLRDVCNEDQMGFVTPEVFNSLSELAQLNVFNEMFQGMSEAKRRRLRGIDSKREVGMAKMMREDLSQFVTEQELRDIDTVNEYEDNVSDGISLTEVNQGDGRAFRKPSDIGRVISMRSTSCLDNNMEILYDVEKLNRVLNSNLSRPTPEFPVALISNRIQVFPNEHDDQVFITYYRVPRSVLVIDVEGQGRAGDVDFTSTPTFAVQSIDPTTGFAIPNPKNCRDFELPGHYLDALVMELSKLIGVRLRDDYLISVGTRESVEQDHRS